MTTASDTPVTRLVRSWRVYIYNIAVQGAQYFERESHLSRWNQQVQTRRTRLVSRIVRTLRRVAVPPPSENGFLFLPFQSLFFTIIILWDDGSRKCQLVKRTINDGRLLPIVFPAEACPESFNHLTPATRRIRSAGVPRRRRFHLTRQPVGASRFSKADGDPSSRPIFLFSNLDQIWCNV